jgi:membrane-bound serine protease (ClpP class)
MEEALMRNRWLLWILLFFLFLGLTPGRQSAAQAGGPAVVVLRFEGALHPVMLEHLKRGLQTAGREGAETVILELNTPGGSIDLMNQLVQQIRGSQVPIIVYVSPRGAMAASAGTLITLAGHLSAMAPETTIGAASPVGGAGEDLGETMASKEKEVLKATARSLTTDRPEEARKLADDMIQNARAVSVDEALKIGLVDFKAANLEDLMQQMDGHLVNLQGKSIPLHTSGARIITVEQTFMENLLLVLANPNIAFLLLAIGVQAILIEISSPGGWVAGFIGSVCLLLAIYGMGLLPVNWFGILFLVLAFVLFILDIKAPTHGALTIAGVGSFIVGALVLFNSPNVPSFQRVSVPLVVGTGLVIGLIFFTILGFALRAQRIPLRMGRDSLIGQVGLVNTPLNPTGTVQLGSELWTATLENGGAPIKRGEQVEVTGIDRLEIKVRKINSGAS